MALNNDLLTCYRAEGANTSDLTTAEFQALKYNGARNWWEFLQNLGYRGTVNDMMYKYLSDELYDVLNPPTTPGVITDNLYDLDASEAELISAGADGKLTVTNMEATFSYLLETGATTQFAAGSAGFLTQTGQTFSSAAQIVGVEFYMTNLPIHAAGSNGYVVNLAAYKPDFTKLETVAITAKGDGTFDIDAGGNGLTGPSTINVPSIDSVGMYWNGSTSQFGFVLDGVDQGYLTGTFQSGDDHLLFLTIQGLTVPADYDQETVSCTLVTKAVDMVGGFPTGTVDIAGTTI